LSSDSAADHYQRGLSLRRVNQFDQALAAFDAAVALDPALAEAHNARGIVLATLGRAEDALASFDRALTLRPDYAECCNNRGIVLQELGRLDVALVSFDQALVLKPDNARVHNNRGTVLSELQRWDDSVAAYERAIALDPSYAEAFYNRGLALHDQRHLEDALASFDEAIALWGDYPQAHHNRGAVLQDLLLPNEAIRAYAAAIRLSPDDAESPSESYANQAYCHLQMGRFEDGWRLHEWRKKLPRPVGDRSFAQPLWLGREDLSNKTLFVHWEQGFGDTLQFCRYGRLLEAMGARVVMSVQDPLYRLLSQLQPQLEILREAEVPQHFDYHCPMMSLPLALQTSLQTIPAAPRYLASDPGLRQGFESRLPARTRPRVGIAWSGSASHKNDRNRSIDPAVLAPLFSVDAQWISLQYEAGPPPHPKLQSVSGPWQDFADTAAIVDAMDLVVTVDTSVAHLAGAMGKAALVLLPFNSDWRWLLQRDDSPWYPSLRLSRQNRAESWECVISRVRPLVCELIQSCS
jgi:tetratricopeptide (TPR) repeat protein